MSSVCFKSRKKEKMELGMLLAFHSLCQLIQTTEHVHRKNKNRLGNFEIFALENYNNGVNNGETMFS